MTGSGVTANNIALKDPSPYERLFVTRIRNFTSYVSSVSCDNDLSSTIVLRVYTQSPPQVGSNIRVINLQNNLKAMLIPNGILILIGTIIIAVVLKILLDSLDEELF